MSTGYADLELFKWGVLEGAAGHQQSGDHRHHLPVCKPHFINACRALCLCMSDAMSVSVYLFVRICVEQTLCKNAQDRRKADAGCCLCLMCQSI